MVCRRKKNIFGHILSGSERGSGIRAGIRAGVRTGVRVGDREKNGGMHAQIP